MEQPNTETLLPQSTRPNRSVRNEFLFNFTATLLFLYTPSLGYNGPRHLAIYDPETASSSFAVGVSVGSYYNPITALGLAHLLEHALFLGNAAYPDATEYDAFVTSHGGHSNAYTDSEKTVYYSSVSYEAFPEGLDRMLNMFASPNFDLADVSKEIMAVDSEHAIHHNDATWRILSAVGSLQAPPLNQFSTGNNITLGNYSEVVVQLRKFFDSYYCPSRMSLVTYGPYDADSQLDFARELFATIESRIPYGCSDALNFSVNPLLESGPIPKSNVGKMIRIGAPKASEPQVWLCFPMSFAQKSYHAQPLSYLELVITYRGEGGLIDSLIKSGDITGIDFMTD